jgi:hypothetical protein
MGAEKFGPPEYDPLTALPVASQYIDYAIPAHFPSAVDYLSSRQTLLPYVEIPRAGL